MKAIRATFIFMLLISFFVIPLRSIAQECNGEYKITATFDANGNKVQTDYGNGRILVVSTNFGGLRQANVAFWAPVIQMYGNNSLYFNYSGYNNGWYIYRCDVFMAGTNWLYLHQSGQYVRLELAWAKGNYNEYEKSVK